MALKLCSNYIGLLVLFYFKLFIFPPDVKGQNPSEALPHEPPARLNYESLAEFTVPSEPHLHFTIFKNSILLQKTDISKRA